MRSKVAEQMLMRTYRKIRYSVDAYTKMIMTGTRQRFHYYFSWKGFNLGFGFCRTTGISGWRYMLSLDLGFLAFWIYFVQEKNN